LAAVQHILRLQFIYRDSIKIFFNISNLPAQANSTLSLARRKSGWVVENGEVELHHRCCWINPALGSLLCCIRISGR